MKLLFDMRSDFCTLNFPTLRNLVDVLVRYSRRGAAVQMNEFVLHLYVIDWESEIYKECRDADVFQVSCYLDRSDFQASNFQTLCDWVDLVIAKMGSWMKASPIGHLYAIEWEYDIYEQCRHVYVVQLMFWFDTHGEV